jgi:hypothetical protein
MNSKEELKIPCQDPCVLEQHGHCKLHNFPTQIISHQLSEPQLDQVDCFSSVEVLKQQ